MRVRAALLAVLTAIPAWGAQQDEKKLSFRFKDASADAVLSYVSSVTGWIFVQEKRVSGTIEAVSDTEVPVSKCLDFLNAALRRHGATIPNPYSPGLPKPGQILKVQDVDEAKRRPLEIFSGANPDDIPITDQVRTQILPLKAVNVQDVNKELGELIKSAMGSDGQVSFSTYSNSIVLTGRSDGINRVARVLRVIDVSASAELKIKVFSLKNADAADTAKTLNEVFKRETMRADTGTQNPMGQFMRMFSGGGGRGGGEGGGAGGNNPKALASEMVRITAEPRTNSIIVSATEDNVKIIEELIVKLDDRSAGATKLKLYALRFADATTAAKVINDLFAEAPSNSQASRGGGGGRGQMMIPAWMGGQPQSQGANNLTPTQEVRTVADLRTNSILVAANEQKLLIIDDVVRELDRQVDDLLEVKIYKLENADAEQMATILQALFRPQVQATQNSGRSTGGGRQTQGGAARMMGMAGSNQGGSGGGLLPSQEIEVTSDVRTRSVIVKASREYIKVMDEVIKKLDQDPTETVSTYVVPLRNADSATLATTLQNLLKGQGAAGTSGLGTQQQQNRGPFSGMQTNQNQNGTQQGSSRGGGGSGQGSTRTRGGNLGPLDGQEEPAGPPAQEDELPRRGIEGQADIQSDPSTNSLVIRTSPRNFQSIQGLLKDLDRMRPQVLIKVLIADVTLDDQTQFGLEGFWENKLKVRGGDSATQRAATDFALPTQGASYLLSGDEFEASLKLFASEGKLKVLATPRIMVLDNQTANINVGKEVPRITNTQVNQLGNTVNTVQYENIGIILDVTPHINPDGLVTMIVTPEISDLASAAESVEITPGVLSPTFTVNRASTSVAVRTGTTIAIGGLIRESIDDTVQKIPVLGDIPLLGYLFSSTTHRKVKRELMIFLTPYVAFSASQLEEITQLERARLKLIDPRDMDAESDRWLEKVTR
ncbi:MAG TPA: secretin N-terminal domain-containing protein [Planctomycetota bacterium]